MVATILIIVGAVAAAGGTICAFVGGALQSKQTQQAQKDLIDYELKTLGRRDGKQ